MKYSVLFICIISCSVFGYHSDDLYLEYLDVSLNYSHAAGDMVITPQSESSFYSSVFRLSLERKLKRMSWWGKAGIISTSFDDTSETAVEDIELGMGFYLKRSKYGTRWQFVGSLYIPVSDPSSGVVFTSPLLIPIDDSTDQGGFTSGNIFYSLGTRFSHSIFPLRPLPVGLDISLLIHIPNNDILDMWFEFDSKFSFSRWDLIEPYLYTEALFCRNSKTVNGTPLISTGVGVTLFSEKRITVHSHILWGVTNSELERYRSTDSSFFQYSQTVPNRFKFELSFTYSIPTRGDADFDAVPDKVDNCIYTAEDRDGYFDHDGCPDDDNDSDGIVDLSDSCPNMPEDYDGYQDSDGCPEYDNDLDSITDESDSCPNDPEDFDLFEDRDGCPEYDNDGDGIVDMEDDCPLLKEVYNSESDSDGCPDIQVLEDQLIIQGAIYFDSDSYELTSRDTIFIEELISRVSTELLIKIEIIGHTDSTAETDYNYELGYNRVEAVGNLFLDHQGIGISEEQITLTNRGEDVPYTVVNNKDGLSLNRRVDIQIWMERQGE